MPRQAASTNQTAVTTAPLKVSQLLYESLSEKETDRTTGREKAVYKNSRKKIHSEVNGFAEYGYVYELSNLSGTFNPAPTTIPRSLLSIFALDTKPSITYRIRIALALTEAVLQLHTAGMWESGAATGPYLIGYEHTRADNALEMTETIAPDGITDPYRHPSAQGSSRQSYCKAFDLFALACVLIEIAIWQNLEEILHGFQSTEVIPSTLPNRVESPICFSSKMKAASDNKREVLDSPSGRGRKSLLASVAHCAGDSYKLAVETCLDAAGVPPDADEENDPKGSKVDGQMSADGS
ncbi:hypothetical protein MMC25_005699 [Agyrium rufum]|nr:hypothetical protein [Agyrium rufum]